MEGLTVYLIYFNAVSLGTLGLVIYEQIFKKENKTNIAGICLVFLLAFFCSYLWSNNLILELCLSAAGAVFYLVLKKLLRDYTASGPFFILFFIGLSVIGFIYSFNYYINLQTTLITKAALLLFFFIGLFFLPTVMLIYWGSWEPLIRKKYHRPSSRRTRPLAAFPKVSIHIPCYSEPPDMVIATLDSMNRLDYPDFEVLLIDNNTADPELWRPLEAHCAKLGGRFRFFHVSPLSGAKAGALNYALAHTAPDAMIIGVVDSDYQVKPNWLRDLIGYFEDPSIGLVQPPHGYRGWEKSAYFRMCNWEYQYFFITGQTVLNEFDTAIGVGTMTLIRKKALHEAGGWSEWCLTEDSEASIKIHEHGYSSIAIREPYGFGLIPETYEGYRKQRYRWSFGPMQEFKAHFLSYMMKPFCRPTKLMRRQKFSYLRHGLAQFNNFLRYVMGFCSLILTVSMLSQNETVQLPPVLLILALCLAPSQIIYWWLIYRKNGASFPDAMGAMIASRSLLFIHFWGSMKALFKKKIPWRRTDKFKAGPSGLKKVLLACLPELIIGLILVPVCFVALMSLPSFSLVSLFLIDNLFNGLSHLSAPVLSFMAERAIRKRNAPSGEVINGLKAEQFTEA